MTLKKLHIKTYGCQMNVYDSTRMGDVLAPHGYAASDAVEDADLVVLNTCHIREKAAEKMYSDLGRLRLEKITRERNGDRPLMIAVAGCVAQAEGEEIIARAPYVDLVVGPQSYHTLPGLIEEAERTRESVVALEFTEEAKFDLLPETVSTHGAQAFVSVQEGCDKFCTFCVVPYTRGAEFSRPVEAVEREVAQHLAQGAMEITLLGQNVNAYHGRDAAGTEITLGGLIRRLAALPGLARLRYTTSHPRDMDEALIAAHGEVENLMPFLHLPVQSGSDRILKAMNRKHTAAEYLVLIEKLRTARPDMAFSSDFIVGFPGETEQDFEATLRLFETVGFASAYMFKYSARPGTPAAERDDAIPEAVKEARLAQLLETANRCQRQFNQQTVGKTLPVLLEKPGRKPGQAIGKSPYMQSVVLDHAADRIGQLVHAEIQEAYEVSLRGVMV